MVARSLGSAVLLSSLCSAADPVPLEWTAGNGTTVTYRWSGPAAVERGKTYPLVLFMHGAGERGTDNQAQLKHGVSAILKQADALGQPCYLIAPQCPEGRWWSEPNKEWTRLAAAAEPNALLEAVLALVDQTAAKNPVDPARIYVTGISMGGFATWDLIGRAPGKFAAAMPICGGGDISLVGKFKATPIKTFHGEADDVVPVASTREMIAALEAAGAHPLVTYYPGVKHDSWTQSYDDPESVRWLFAQRKP